MYVVQIFKGRDYDRLVLHSKERADWVVKAAIAKRVDRIKVERGGNIAQYRRTRQYVPDVVLAPQK